MTEGEKMFIVMTLMFLVSMICAISESQHINQLEYRLAEKTPQQEHCIAALDTCNQLNESMRGYKHGTH